MLKTKKKNTLKGMTLIEVIVAMTVIILVTVIAYMGVNTSANFIQRGTDLRNADGPLVSQLEANRKAYYNEGAAVTEIVGYNVQIYSKITDAEGNIETDEYRKECVTMVTEYADADIAGVISAADSGIEYRMKLPYIVTTVPETP